MEQPPDAALTPRATSATPVPHGPFRTRETAGMGLAPADARAVSHRTRFIGVRAHPAVPDTLEMGTRAALLVLPAEAVVSHTTALELHGAEIPWGIETDGRIEVTIPPGGTVSRRPQLRVHVATARPPTRLLRGIRVVEPATAWLQVAARCTVDDLVVLGDALTRRKQPLTSIDAITAGLRAARAGARGVARAREALRLVRPGTDSSMESRTRLLLVRAGLPEPLVNAPILEAGRFLARADLLYPEARVAIEYDGDVHRTDPATWRRDVERRQRLEEAGWVIVTATADDVLRHPTRLIARVRHHLARRHHPPPPR